MIKTSVDGQKLSIIQLLRGCAAMLVVLFHFCDRLISEWPRVSEIMAHGQIGVDIFFIISGFVIYISTENQSNRRPGSFLLRRFFRVVVPAWAAMLLLLSVILPYLSDLLLSILFIPLKNNHPPGYGYSYLIVVWTLTYELVFYLIFAIAMASNVGKKHRGVLTSLLVIFMVFAIQTLTGIYTLDADSAGLFSDQKYFPMQIFSLLGNPLFLMFVLGIALASIYQQGFLNRLFIWRYALLALGFVLAFLTIKFQYRDGNGLTNSGLLAFWIVIIALTLQSLMDTGRPGVGGKWMTYFLYLGELSFSLYLIHPIIRSIAMLAPIKSLWVESIGQTSMFFLMLGTTFLGSLIFYNIVEVPSQRYGKALCRSSSAAFKTESIG